MRPQDVVKLMTFFYFIHESAGQATMVVPGKNGVGGKARGCPCWFDPDGRTGLVTASGSQSCACCPDGYLQCGYPMGNRCYKASDYSDGEREGCLGVKPYGQWTLSQIGAPCHYNTSDYTCAICTGKTFQCSNYAYPPGPDDDPFEEGSYCRPYNAEWNYRCWGNIQDCRNNPLSCDENATCKSTGYSITDDWTRYACVCNDGYVGSGFICVENTSSKLDDLPSITELL